MEITDFVTERGRGLVRTAYLLTGDLAAAEDLVQTALARCVPRWADIEHPVSYVRRAVVNAYLDSRRHGATDVGLDDLDHLPGVEAADLGTRDALWRCVQLLSPRERAVVVLRYYEDLDDAEIAVVLSVKQPTVRATVSRALARLRADHLHLLQDLP
jgi:RNA polymerase sigma factor (sigma-70 family)